MRLGRIVVNRGYIVDLDNPEMVVAARKLVKDELFDIRSPHDLEPFIEEWPDSSLSEADISPCFANPGGAG